MKIRILAGLAAMALAAAAPAIAGKISEASRKEMARILDVVVSHNDSVVTSGEGELAAGQAISVPFSGDRTIEYYVNAVCDDDCGNLDLIMYDSDGTEIDVDDADDNAPVLNVMGDVYRSPLDKPKGDPRPMTLEVRMIACATDTCAYAWRITHTEQPFEDEPA